MKKSVRKVLSIIMAAVMVFALLPIISRPMVVKAETTLPTNHTHGEHADGTCSEHVGWSAISTQDELKTLCEGGGKGYLTADINLERDLSINSGMEISLCLNGYSITLDNSLEVFDVRGTLFLFDENGNSGIITHTLGCDASGICVNGGTFQMAGGKISGNTLGHGCDGGGVCILDGTFIMTGGEISGNVAQEGGGVGVIRGTFIMTGGEISDNTAQHAGGVSARSFTMTGGKISGNTNVTGIWEVSADRFTMTGGVISDRVRIFDEALITDDATIDSIVDNGLAKIIFNSNETNTKTVTQYISKYENKNLAKNTFTNTGKKFVEWTTVDDGSGDSYADESQVNIYEDLILYARWIDAGIDSYVINFKVKNGSWSDGTADDQNINLWKYENEDIALVLSATDIPSVGDKPAPGYMAGEWDVTPTTEKNYSNEASGTFTYTYTYKLDPNAVKYTITYDANGGTVNETSAETGYDLKLTSLPSPEEREGYDFVGWFTSAEGGTEITTDTVFASNDTIYAHWNAHSYTVKFDANGGNGSMDDMSRKYDDNTALTANAFTYESHTFSGWNTASDGSGTSYIDGSIDNLTSTNGDSVTLYAMWDSVSYTISVTNDGNGSATASATSGIKGTNIKLSATPNEGYKFAGWEVVSGGITLADASSAKTTFIIGTSDVEAKATFEEIPATVYSVTVSDDGNGTAISSVTSGIEGTEVTITATPNEGYKFAGWEVVTGGVTLADASSANTSFTIGTSNVEVKANFELIPEDNEHEITNPNPNPDPDPDPEPDPEPDPDPEPEEETPDYLDELWTELAIAIEVGGERTIVWNKGDSLPYDIMKLLKENPQITLVFNYTYEGEDYSVIISGSDIIADPEIPWYGPVYLYGLHGGYKSGEGNY